MKFSGLHIKETRFHAIHQSLKGEGNISSQREGQKEKGEGTAVPYIILNYFCLSSTKPPTRITTAAPTAPATIAKVQSGPVAVVVVVVSTG
jgi:hypothetical protein